MLGFAVEGDAASDDLVVAGVDFAKVFAPDMVDAGDTTTLTFTITNLDASNAVLSLIHI